MGTGRAGAKTTPAAGQTVKVQDTCVAIAWMEHRAQGQQLPTRHTANRTPLEQVTLTIKKAWIYAINMQRDNDFHLILGNEQMNASLKCYLNIEVSGLPAAAPLR
jgi:hypothetical protein